MYKSDPQFKRYLTKVGRDKDAAKQRYNYGNMDFYFDKLINDYDNNYDNNNPESDDAVNTESEQFKEYDPFSYNNNYDNQEFTPRYVPNDINEIDEIEKNKNIKKNNKLKFKQNSKNLGNLKNPVNKSRYIKNYEDCNSNIDSEPVYDDINDFNKYHGEPNEAASIPKVDCRVIMLS